MKPNFIYITINEIEFELNLKGTKKSTHVARCVVVDDGKNDGVHECNHVLGPVGRDAQQHIGAEHVEEKYNIKEAGKIEHSY